VLPARRRPRYDLPSKRYGSLDITISFLKYGAAVIGGIGVVASVLLARLANESGDGFVVFLVSIAVTASVTAVIAALGHGLQLLTDIADATTVSATEDAAAARPD
jgi:hypothetical protein